MRYKRPAIAADGILLYEKKVVVVKRKREPFKGRYALPGGFVEYGERVEDAARREFKEETGLETKIIGLVGVYSAPDRDPRGHVISIVFYLERTGGKLKAGDDAKDISLFSLEKVPELAFDHSMILRDWKGKFLPNARC